MKLLGCIVVAIHGIGRSLSLNAGQNSRRRTVQGYKKVNCVCFQFHQNIWQNRPTAPVQDGRRRVRKWVLFASDKLRVHANNPHQALARPPKIGTEEYLNIARLQEGKLIAFDLLMANHELKIHHKLMTLDVEIVWSRQVTLHRWGSLWTTKL